MPKVDSSTLTTQEEFLKDLEPKETTDSFDAPLNPQPEAKEEVKEEEVPPQNRADRRYKQRWQEEKEANIALAAKLEVLTEAQRLRRETEPSEYIKRAERIFGNDSPNAIEATELLKEALKGTEERATQRALELIREEQAREREATQQAERQLDRLVEDIEDTYGVNLNEQTKQAFFQRLQKVSPKDENGEVIALADHHAVWEDLQSRKTPDNRAKDLASRSMVKNTGAPSTTVEQDANERWLRANGII